jgi:hypothetical protein
MVEVEEEGRRDPSRADEAAEYTTKERKGGRRDT